MGGGSGAATNVDSIPSPRRAAIDKAQAELRLEVTVREELSKELDFLEKGGNPLDYKFGESLLPRFAAQVLSSELDDLCARNTNCSSLENGRYVEQETASCRVTGEVLENGSAGTPGHVSDGPVFNHRDHDEVLGVEGRKNQTSTKKLKQKEFGNGHAASKYLPCDTDESSMCRFQVPPTCSADVQEVGTCVSPGNDGSVQDERKENKDISDDYARQKAMEQSTNEEINPASSAEAKQDGKGVEEQSEGDKTRDVARPSEPCPSGLSTDALVQKNEASDKQKPVSEKAQEDMILEAAETIKAAQKHTMEFSRHKPGSEPARQKSHWDFVLEEMSWMANDFMQERLWKTAAAAQVCRWTAQRLQQTKVADTDLKKNKKRIAHVLANIVTRYWQSAAALTQKPDELSIKKNDDCEAVPMDVDGPAPTEKRRPIHKYVMRASTDLELPKTPHFVPDSLFLMEQFPEESLVFIVSDGALETYRLSIEKNWDAFVSEKLLQDSLNDQRLSGMCSELDLYGDDSRSFGSRTSPKLPDDDYGMHYMPGDLTISKKKRKRILKAQTPKAYDGLSQGGYCDGSNRLASPAKRPTAGAASSIGVIPTKRMRTSAVVARQRAASTTLSPGAHRGNASSASTNSQQEDLLGFPDSRASEGDSVGPRKGGLGTSSLRFKKKKKTKAFHSDFSTDAISNSHLSKTDAELNQLEQDQLKRKSDQYSPLSSEHDTPGTPGSQGVVSMHPMKKLKSSKHSPDFAEAGPSATGLNLTTSSKILRQNSARDRIRRNKATKGFIQSSINPPGVGIPWSATEDQAILALVHDLGPNWELVSDVLSSSSQLKGIFRKPKDCKDRHKSLLDRLSNDNGDNDEPGTSMPKQQSTRVFLQRLQGPMEEDTVKVHLERIVNIVQAHRSKQQQNDTLENQELLPVHASHLSTASQFSLSGVPLSPLDLCEHPMSNGDIPAHGYSLPQHPGLNIPGVMAPNGMRPNSAGLPLLPHLGSMVSPGSAAINAAAARDAQRMAASMRPLSAEEQRLRYTRMVTGRSLQPQANSPGNLPMASLPNSSDCSMPMLPSGNTAGLMGLNRGGLSLPRPTMPGMIPPGPSPGLMPPGGVALPASGSMMAGGIPSPANFMKRAREATQLIRSGRCTEEQKQHIIQELQHQAAQGNPQAVAALNTLSSNNMNLSNPMVSSPTQSFAPQQQQHLSPQQQSQQQQHQQYLQAVRLVNERQQQQQQQQQQQKRIFQQPNNLLQQHQLGMLTQQQQPLLPSQQAQQLSPSQQQQSPVLPGAQHPQQPTPTQMGQLSGQQKVQVPTQKQSLTKQPSFQQQQLLQVQQQSKVGKNNTSGRGVATHSALMPGSQQTANSQLPSPPGTAQAGQAQQRSLAMQQAGKQASMSQPGKVSGQSQGGQLTQGTAGQTSQQKSLQKQSPQGASPVPAAPSTPPPQQQTTPATSAAAPPASQQPASTTTQAQIQRRQQQQQQQQQPQSQQAPQARKSQQKQASALQAPGKNTTQPGLQPLGGSNTGSGPMSIGTSSSGLPPQAALAPSAAGSWKPGQNFPGMYNLTRSTSGGANQGSATTNGNGGVAQNQVGTAAKLGIVPAVNGRTLAQQQQGSGAAQRPVQQQQQQQSLPVSVPVPTNTMNSTRAARPSSVLPSSPSFPGTPVPSLSHGVQPRQVHGGAQRPTTNGSSNPSVTASATAAPPSVVTSSSSPR